MTFVAINALRFILCVFLAGVTPVMAGDFLIEDDHIVSRALFRDAAGTLSIDQIPSRQFDPLPGILAGGYTGGAEWVRLLVRPRADGGELVLRILPSYLNELTLYEADPQQPGSWHAKMTGNTVPWLAHGYPSMALGFTIRPQVATTYYLRLRTNSNSLLQIHALEPMVAAHADVRQGVWQSFYMAIILWIILWAVQDYWLTRDRVIATFAATQAIYLLYALAIMGYLALLMPRAGFLHTLTSYLVSLAVLTSLLFHRQLLALFAADRRALWVVNVLIAGAAFALGLLLANRPSPALQLSSFVALLAAPILFGVAMTTHRDVFPGRWVLIIMYGLLFMSLLSYIPPLLGWGESSSWTLNGALFQGLISALMIGMLLHRRSRQLIDNEVRSRFKLALSEQQLSIEHDRLSEQNRFMAMLTHELKTPLAAIRLSLDAMATSLAPRFTENDDKRRHRIDRALGNINAIVERCAQVDRFEQGGQFQLANCAVVKLAHAAAAASQAPARLSVQADGEIPDVTNDGTLMGVAIANLIDNALKYSPPGSPIEMRIFADTAAAAPGISLTIVNQLAAGVALDAERIFDKYYRGEHAGRQSGSGLGLYLVKGIAQQSGGTISCTQSADQAMVSFHLWIPSIPS